MRFWRRSPLPRILDRVRARFGRAPDPTATEAFTARCSPNIEATARRERVVPAEAPTIRVHPDRVARPSARVELTPAQALELARGGPEALRRDRPRTR